MLVHLIRHLLLIIISNLTYQVVHLFIQTLLKNKTPDVFVIINKERFMLLQILLHRLFGLVKQELITILIFQDH